MKKSIIPIIVLTIVLLISLIVIRNLYPNKYYTITYKASYSTNKVNYDYLVISDAEEYKNILNDINSNKYKSLFSNSFFKNKNLLIINGGIDSEINSLEVHKNSVKATVYYASPLTTNTEIFNHEIYLVPINKNIKNIKINRNIYPDRIY